jgi:hypothetical protein
MQKDMVVLYQEHPDEIDWNNQRDLFTRLCRVIKFDIVGQIFFGKHQVARFDEKRDRNKYFFQQRYSTMKAIKVKVDLLGKIVKEQG